MEVPTCHSMGCSPSAAAVEPSVLLSKDLVETEKRLVELNLFGPSELARLRSAYLDMHARSKRKRPAIEPEKEAAMDSEQQQAHEQEQEVECSLVECCDWLGFNRTVFSDRCFRLANGGGDRINFASFVAAIWLLTAHDLATLSFWMTDTENKGYLEIGEVQSIMTSVGASRTDIFMMDATAKYDPKSLTFIKVARLFATLDSNSDGRVTHDEWCANIQVMHNALMPAFSLQRLIHRKVFKNANVDLAAIEKARRRKREELSNNVDYGAGAGMGEVLSDLSGLFPDLECAICLELLQGEEVDDSAPKSSAYRLLPGAVPSTITTLPCSHRFHTHCIETLRMHTEASQACPLCRSELPISEQTRAPGSDARGLLAHRGAVF